MITNGLWIVKGAFALGHGDFPLDLNKDGSITPDEAIDLAVTSQRGGVVIHQVTPDGGLNRLDFIHLNGTSTESGGSDLCVDRRRRLLYVGGTGVGAYSGTPGLFVVSLYDLPRPGEEALGVFGTKILDENKDLQDDRILGFVPGAVGCSAANDDVTVAYTTQGGVQTVRVAPDPLELKHIAYNGKEEVAGIVRRFNGMRESEYFLEADLAEPAHAYLKGKGYTFTVKVEVKDKTTGSVIGAETVTLSSPDPGAADGKGGCSYGGAKCDYRSVERKGKWSGSELLILTDVLDGYEYGELRDEGRRYESRRSNEWPEARDWDVGNDPYRGYTRKPLKVGIGLREVVVTVEDETLWKLMMDSQFPSRTPEPRKVEDLQVVVLGIDGLRQDALYPDNDVNIPSDGVYADPMGVAGVGQVLGMRSVTDVRYPADPGRYVWTAPVLTGEMEKKHVKLGGVTAVFPSITLASWASIFTGELPGKTGELGNEFFDRTMAAQPALFFPSRGLSGRV